MLIRVNDRDFDESRLFYHYFQTRGLYKLRKRFCVNGFLFDILKPNIQNVDIELTFDTTEHLDIPEWVSSFEDLSLAYKEDLRNKQRVIQRRNDEIHTLQIASTKNRNLTNELFHSFLSEFQSVECHGF